VANLWDVSNMTSTTFGVGSNNTTNGSNAMIAYCWHDVTGKQKFGTYTGDGTTDGSKTITTGFRPGFIMIKCTSSGSTNWIMMDSSREPLGTIELELNANNSNQENNSGRDITFSSTGFTVAGNNNVNGNGDTYIYVAFAGSYSDYITDYNTDGTIDSRVKASDTTGFSIVSWLGDGTTNGTFGHGLSSAPDFIVAKDRDSNSVNNNWHIWHTSLSSATHNLNFTTGAESNVATATSYGGIGDPSATTIKAVSGTVDSRTMNESGDRYIAYCWTETAGVSKFGSWTGDGTSDGSKTVDFGFKPSLLIFKRTDSAGYGWNILDNTRDTANPIGKGLQANTTSAENTSDLLTFTDTGIQFTETAYAGTNASGGTYIYAAFADTREAAFWLDQSGNDNDWQPVNLDHNDTVLDSPTNNFATLNPLTGGSSTTSNGNLETTIAPVNGARVSTFAVKSGQWYCEMTPTTIAGYFVVGIGVPYSKGWTSSQEANAKCIVYTSQGNLTSVGAWSTSSSTVSGTYTTNDVIGIALDMDANTIEFYKNGTSVGSATIDTGDDDVAFLIGNSSGSSNGAGSVNFGQLPFKYGPPA
jgi:hypothetical protein